MTTFENVRPWGGDPVDLVVTDGLISAVNPATGGSARVALPSFADVHCHLDSNRLGLPFRPHTGKPGRWGSILNDREHWRSAEKSVAERATYALGEMIAHGATHVRSHAQVDADTGLEKFEGVLAARQTHRERATVTVVAFPQVGIHLEKGAYELLDEAVGMGADLVGGIDPCEIDRDPVRHLDSVFALAEKHSVGVDVHLHERGSLGLFSLSLFCDRVETLGLQGRATLSHAFCLADGTPAVHAAIDRLAALDIAVTTIAPSGHLDLPLRRMVEAGVRVGLGMDGQRDYWSPWGNGDMLDRAHLLAFTQGFRDEADLELALAVASRGGRSVDDAGLDRDLVRPGFAVGDPADLVLLDTESAATALLDRPFPRTVVHRGRVVAEGGQLI
jgi:cytosine/creatinine deaminase